MTRFNNDVETAFQLEIWTGRHIYPRAYCDDPDIGPVGVYLNKSPVCKLKIDPTTVGIGNPITWDVSLSRSSTGTVNTFDLAFGGPTTGGDISNGDFQAGPKTGQNTYQNVGFYTAELVVTDLLNESSQPCKVDVEVVDQVDFNVGHVGTSLQGSYVVAPTGTTTPANTGLSGADLNFRSLYVSPFNSSHVWACVETGVAVTIDSANNWTVINKAALGTPVNSAGDAPAPTTNDLDQIDLAFDLVDSNVVYVVRSTATRVWLYWTEDYGASWQNVQVGF